MPLQFYLDFILEDPTMLSTLFTTLITTIVAVLIGIGGWYWGHKTAMKQVDKHFKRQLEIEASTEVINSLSEICRKNSILIAFIASHNAKINLYKNPSTKHLALRELSKAYEMFFKLEGDVFETLLGYMYSFGKKEIVFKDFTELRSKIHDGFNKLREAYTPYRDCLLLFYHPQNTPIPINLDENKLEQLEEHGKEAIKTTNDLTNHAIKMIQELQNHFLGDLLKHKIPTI